MLLQLRGSAAGGGATPLSIQFLIKGPLLAVAAAGMLSDLALLPPARCVDLSDGRRCEAARPKPWTTGERDAVAGATERLRAHALVRGVLRGARANGYRGVQRFATDTQRDAQGNYVPKFGPGFVLFTPRIIGLTDAFFALAELRDGRGGYRVSDLVLLHEVIHAYDDRKRSTDPGFTALTGWKFIEGKWQYTNRISISAYNGVYAETVTLYARARYAEAWARDRAFATSLPVPLPRLQALVTPAETFADILAHLILDRTAREYLQPEVVRWFESNIFPELSTP